MAYSTSNPPQKVAQGIGSGGLSVWAYRSADAHGDVDAADYFEDGEVLGMKVGDIVIVTDSDNGATTVHAVTAVDADGATISAGTFA